MVLESLSKTNNKTVHVCNFDAKAVFKVGRGHVADVRISDISVSRHHSTFQLC